MNLSTQVPPGFRFHPTDEELVDYYLRRKVNARRIDLDVIKEVDLYKIEPWDLQEICKLGDDEQNEWYFFSHKDKKYPTGTRTNRATTAGFWKATGRDKAIYSKHDLVGMRKTLVFYKGRAPNGQKSDWIMHEYRLETNENGPPQEEGWVVCRVFKKKPVAMRNTSDHDSPYWYDDHIPFMADIDSPQQASQSNLLRYPPHNLPFRIPQDHHINLPILDNSKLLLPSPHGLINGNNALIPCVQSIIQSGSANTIPQHNNSNNHQNANMVLIGSNSNDDDQGGLDQVTDWRVLDKFVASQLSHEDDANLKANGSNISSSVAAQDIYFSAPLSSEPSNKEESAPDNASTSTSGSPVDAWK